MFDLVNCLDCKAMFDQQPDLTAHLKSECGQVNVVEGGKRRQSSRWGKHLGGKPISKTRKRKHPSLSTPAAGALLASCVGAIVTQCTPNGPETFDIAGQWQQGPECEDEGWYTTASPSPRSTPSHLSSVLGDEWAEFDEEWSCVQRDAHVSLNSDLGGVCCTMHMCHLSLPFAILTDEADCQSPEPVNNISSQTLGYSSLVNPFKLLNFAQQGNSNTQDLSYSSTGQYYSGPTTSVPGLTLDGAPLESEDVPDPSFEQVIDFYPQNFERDGGYY